MKKSVLIAGIIISLALIGGGVFWYVKNQNRQPVNNPPITNNRQEQIATSTKENDTSNWQTYRNEEYGFEVKYPGGWEIKEYKNIITFRTEEKQKQLEKNSAVSLNDFSIEVIKSISDMPSSQKYNDIDKMNLEQWIDKEISGKYLSDKKIIDINGIKGYKVSTGIYTMGFFSDSIYIEYNNKIYVLNNLNSNLSENYQMISSFKFLK